MSTQLEQAAPLRLADALDAWDGKLMMPAGWREQTSTELRRLHEECQRLAAEVANRNRRAIEGDEAVKGLANVHKYYENLHALNQELLKTLHSISLASQDSGSTREGMGLYARAAITKAEGEKQ